MKGGAGLYPGWVNRYPCLKIVSRVTSLTNFNIMYMVISYNFCVKLLYAPIIGIKYKQFEPFV